MNNMKEFNNLYTKDSAYDSMGKIMDCCAGLVRAKDEEELSHWDGKAFTACERMAFLCVFENEEQYRRFADIREALFESYKNHREEIFRMAEYVKKG